MPPEFQRLPCGLCWTGPSTASTTPRVVRKTLGATCGPDVPALQTHYHPAGHLCLDVPHALKPAMPPSPFSFPVHRLLLFSPHRLPLKGPQARNLVNILEAFSLPPATQIPHPVIRQALPVPSSLRFTPPAPAASGPPSSPRGRALSAHLPKDPPEDRQLRRSPPFPNLQDVVRATRHPNPDLRHLSPRSCVTTLTSHTVWQHEAWTASRVTALSWVPLLV